MKQTTLCYLEQDGKYLMLHRTKKEHDENRDKWIGIGGKFEDRESPEDCMRREILEETGLCVEAFRYRGIVTFVSDRYPTEYMHLFTVTAWHGEQTECDEGELAWIDKSALLRLPMWEGDRIFLHLIDDPGTPFFSLKLTYRGDTLTEAVLDGALLKC
ncbi:MAG: 8-oxo-dGTP diphosphatase [Clostridia bacterium]|nr:8-oxo-dGTP diphosphatase [Clostridia bacterium]MBR2926202.1 8-oxo-dGTP diphosphatase [Clostridia bacterium]